MIEKDGYGGYWFVEDKLAPTQAQNEQPLVPLVEEPIALEDALEVLSFS